MSVCESEPSGCIYEIRMKGHLDSRWSSYFEGWTIVNVENGEVLLRSLPTDQSGLHGVLIKIRDLNLTLLSVRVRGSGND